MLSLNLRAVIAHKPRFLLFMKMGKELWKALVRFQEKSRTEMSKGMVGDNEETSGVTGKLELRFFLPCILLGFLKKSPQFTCVIGAGARLS